MPRGDRTGPDGSGPMTGRRAGFCNDFDQPGYMNTGRRVGRGFFNSFRTGFGRFGTAFENRDFYSQSDYRPESEKAYLEQEVKNLKIQLSELETRLSDLTEG